MDYKSLTTLYTKHDVTVTLGWQGNKVPMCTSPYHNVYISVKFQESQLYTFVLTVSAKQILECQFHKFKSHNSSDKDLIVMKILRCTKAK